MPGGSSMFALMISRMSPRPERYVPQSTEPLLDVVEPAEREEVVLLVVVERRLLAEPPPDGVRVLVDLDVERVVVEPGLRRLGICRQRACCKYTSR